MVLKCAKLNGFLVEWFNLMDSIKSLLRLLGIDQTLWIQLVCFLVCYIALTELIFKPYMRAFHKREQLTIGNEESAIRIIEESEALQHEYEQKMRLLNTEIKSVYEQRRLQGLKEQEQLIKKAREQASSLLVESRGRVTAEVQAAHKSLMAEVPAVSSAIASRLLGKDISV
jgi:F-type H+-transporting ATPase subunit b